MSNYDEFVAYTDPTNSVSKFVIGLEPIVVAPVKVQTKSPLRLMAAQSLAASPSSEGFALKWQSAVGRTYSVYTTSDLTAGWDDQPIEEIKGTGGVVEYIPPRGNATMFFKVSVRLSDDYGKE